ncbi:MAG TPA: cytochrome c-type biogenesis CcmF C-terminal domain-containing protein [Anaerolineae bacterium]|nr:cytochrome c-type biogenesis CcmF C-terminal domain-containing protein [Anaerolineae bacterium]
MWAGQEGSLLVWLWFLAVFVVVAVRQRAAWARELEPYALAVLGLTEFFFALLLCIESKPFVLLPARAIDGAGLNPLLENPGMVYHPPTLLLGYAAYTVPFAYAIAALVSGRLAGDWLRGLRRWNLLAWGFLGLGILLGAQWAYVELGWGGYWGWDAVENASLIPWLTGTALLHSVMIQERRGLFRVWNLLLIVGTFLLCVFATFITRSGFVQSVHAFSASNIGYYFLSFIGLWLVAALWLLAQRRRQLRTEAMVEEVLSREGTFLLNNVIFTGLAAAVMLGTLFPALTEALSGTQIALGRSFFDRVSGPVALAMLALLGVCPLLGWRRSGNLRAALPVPIGVGLATVVVLALVAGVHQALALFAFGLIALVATTVAVEFVRGVQARHKITGEGALLALYNLVRKNRRRYGGYIVHLAVVLMALGITGEALFKTERQVTLQRGESLAVGRYVVRYEDLATEMLANKERHVATVGVYLGEQRIATLRPEYNFYNNVQQYVSEVAIRSTAAEDLYVAMAGISTDVNAITFRVLLNPLMAWLWVGGIVMLLGTAVAFWPEGSRQARVAVPAVRRAVS